MTFRMFDADFVFAFLLYSLAECFRLTTIVAVQGYGQKIPGLGTRLDIISFIAWQNNIVDGWV
jgi:hypothetical protein